MVVYKSMRDAENRFSGFSVWHRLAAVSIKTVEPSIEGSRIANPTTLDSLKPTTKYYPKPSMPGPGRICNRRGTFKGSFEWKTELDRTVDWSSQCPIINREPWMWGILPGFNRRQNILHNRGNSSLTSFSPVSSNLGWTAKSGTQFLQKSVLFLLLYPDEY